MSLHPEFIYLLLGLGAFTIAGFSLIYYLEKKHINQKN